MADHTPGPWAYDGVRVYAPAFDDVTSFTKVDGEVVEHRGGLVALPYAPRASEFGVSEANAHLIAAAPELLAALKALTGGLWIEAVADENEPIRRFLVAARAAIARAEGRS